MHWLRRAIIVCAVLLAAWAATAHAHLTPNSEVQIDFGQREAVADIIIPQGEYAFATGNPTGNDTASLAGARAFLLQHIRIAGPDGRAWTVTIERIEFAQIAGPPDLHAIARLTPPAGANARRMTIDWSAVIDRVPNHFVLFVARSDFSSGKLDDKREVLGALQGARHVLSIDRGDGRALRGFGAAIALGMEHIAEGHDHLLFLIALLLPAPILTNRHRWAAPRRPGDAVWKLTKIVTAFTIGHSITLIGAAFFGWQLPARPVEIGIALSILISAIHAWRPIFPGREPIVAAGFGLVHGLAFATVISRFGLGINEKAASILGFNLGIELVQLLVVIAIMPALMLLSRTRWYPPFRVTGAAFAGFAAMAWMVERIAGVPNAIAGAVDAVLTYAPWFVALLTIAAIVAWHATRRDTLQPAR